MLCLFNSPGRFPRSFSDNRLAAGIIAPTLLDQGQTPRNRCAAHLKLAGIAGKIDIGEKLGVIFETLAGENPVIEMTNYQMPQKLTYDLKIVITSARMCVFMT